jgi:hypothetical protein
MVYHKNEVVMVDQREAGSSFWESFNRPYPVVFVLLVFFGLDLEFVVRHGYDEQIVEKNRELSAANENLKVLNTRLAESGEAPQAADKK